MYIYSPMLKHGVFIVYEMILSWILWFSMVMYIYGKCYSFRVGLYHTVYIYITKSSIQPWLHLLLICWTLHELIFWPPIYMYQIHYLGRYLFLDSYIILLLRLWSIFVICEEVGQQSISWSDQKYFCLQSQNAVLLCLQFIDI